MGFIVFILSLTQGRFLVGSCESDVFSDTIYSYFHNDSTQALSIVLAYPSNNLEDARYHILILMKKYGYDKVINHILNLSISRYDLETVDVGCCRCCRTSHQTKKCRSHTHQNGNFIFLKCYICNNPHPPATPCINMTHGKELSHKIILPQHYTILPVIEEEKETDSDYVFVNSNEVEIIISTSVKSKKNLIQKFLSYIF